MSRRHRCNRAEGRRGSAFQDQGHNESAYTPQPPFDPSQALPTDLHKETVRASTQLDSMSQLTAEAVTSTTQNPPPRLQQPPSPPCLSSFPVSTTTPRQRPLATPRTKNGPTSSLARRCTTVNQTRRYVSLPVTASPVTLRLCRMLTLPDLLQEGSPRTVPNHNSWCNGDEGLPHGPPECARQR